MREEEEKIKTKTNFGGRTHGKNYIRVFRDFFFFQISNLNYVI